MSRFLLILFSAFVLAGVVSAQTPQPSDDDVNRVAKQLYCPVCENVPLDVCPTKACADWRADIRTKLAQGWTDTRIKEYFAQQYGDRVLATPPVRGFDLNLVVYVVPPLAVLVGGFVLYRFLRARQRPAAASAAEPAAPTEPDAYQARLEKELRERL
jgi:cytochrome c-type biogenesis protein CcmH